MQEDKKPIYVTQPALPPLEEFIPYLERIWDSKILTNNGPFHQQFEKELAQYLDVKYLSLFANGTLALITALQVLRITGEVITTPFSFVATTHALWWNNIKPVFVDIEPDFFTLDPEKIEAAITPQTTAILAVHVYGNPCRIDAIQKIADKYGLKVIYDAAHAFGVRMNNIPVVEFGDLSVLSFHATKVFNTFEGGAIVCHESETKERIDQLKNFGIINETTVVRPGYNGKMNEFQSAAGLLQLRHIDEALYKRKKIVDLYRALLRDVEGLASTYDIQGVRHNYSYFPVRINSEGFGITRDDLYNKFAVEKIYTRRYFYPLISQYPMYSTLKSAEKENLPVAERIAQEILCLPVYPDLALSSVESICDFIKKRRG
ncbi:MAG: DegT/DnrJ/EryC1/StrS family aminotransferase [Bacteroidales bacterium]|nr:DegT/DnrJ/EryC1/StrS family aminotransferase [Bacteroidales bacterium]